MLGIDKAPGRNYYKSSGKAVGRPDERKIRPRPKKNLWFIDKRLWKVDLDVNHNRNYILRSTVGGDQIACNGECTVAYGKWDTSRNMGITFYKSRPIHTVIKAQDKLVERASVTLMDLLLERY